MNAKIEKFINKRKAKEMKRRQKRRGPSPLPLPCFPDYSDVLKIFNEVNAEQGLGLNSREIDAQGMGFKQYATQQRQMPYLLLHRFFRSA